MNPHPLSGPPPRSPKLDSGKKTDLNLNFWAGDSEVEPEKRQKTVSFLGDSSCFQLKGRKCEICLTWLEFEEFQKLRLISLGASPID